MAITIVQGPVNVDASTLPSPMVINLPQTPVTGNTLILGIDLYVSYPTIISVEQQGVTWTRISEILDGDLRRVEVWYGVVGATPGTAITVSWTAYYPTPFQLLATVFELGAGLDNVSPVDQVAYGYGYNEVLPNTTDSGTIATTGFANEVWLALIQSQTGNGTLQSNPTNGFTFISNFAGASGSIAFLSKQVTAIGTANVKTDGEQATPRGFTGTIIALKMADQTPLVNAVITATATVDGVEANLPVKITWIDFDTGLPKSLDVGTTPVTFEAMKNNYDLTVTYNGVPQTQNFSAEWGGVYSFNFPFTSTQVNAIIHVTATVDGVNANLPVKITWIDPDQSVHTQDKGITPVTFDAMKNTYDLAVTYNGVDQVQNIVVDWGGEYSFSFPFTSTPPVNAVISYSSTPVATPITVNGASLPSGGQTSVVVGTNTSLVAPGTLPGYVFSHWTINGTTVIANPLTIVISQDIVLVAVYTSVTPNHILNIGSNINGVGFTINIGGTIVSYVTPFSGTLEEGTYEITMPNSVMVGSTIYSFSQWENGSTNPVRTVSLTSDTTVTATYATVPPGSMYIDTTPVKGSVYVNGSLIGVAPQTVTGLAPGDYVVSFGAVANYSAPANQTKSVVSGQTTDVLGTYQIITGSLYIDTAPVKGTVFVDNIERGIAPVTVANLTPGSHSVSFGSVSGYSTPASQNPTVISGQTVNVLGTYGGSAQGTLAVASTPAGIQIIVEGVIHTTPFSIPLNAGTYSFTWPTLSGYYPPSPATETFTITSNTTTNVNKVYQAIPIDGYLTIATNPVNGEVFVNGSSWGTAPQTRLVAAGQYNVSYGEVTGYTKPSSTVANVVANETTIVTATYTSSVQKGILSIDTAPIKGGVFIDLQYIGLAPVDLSLDAGEYNISFTNVAEYTAPAPVRLTVVANQTTTYVGTYVLTPNATMIIRAYDQNIEVVAAGKILETGETFNTPVTLPVVAGTYTIELKYLDRVKSQQATALAGQVTEVKVPMSGTVPGPGFNPMWLIPVGLVAVAGVVFTGGSSPRKRKR